MLGSLIDSYTWNARISVYFCMQSFRETKTIFS